MGIGPQMKCDECGTSFYGGERYNPGSTNFCHECIVNLADSIDCSTNLAKSMTEEQYNSLGATQKGFISLVHKSGGLKAMGGTNHLINILKRNAKEIDEIPPNPDDDVQYIMGMLEKFRKTYKHTDGNDLLIGGLDSYISPQGIQDLAEEHNFQKHKNFHIADRSVLSEVEKYLSDNWVVAIAAWSQKKRIDVWLGRQLSVPKESKDGGSCFIATAVYGSYEAAQVRVLRTFRDEYLMNTTLGKFFVKVYYVISPYIAKFVANNDSIKHILAKRIFDPIIRSLSNKQ